MPTHRDSIDKIAHYFEMVTTAPFSYKGKIHYPKPLQVSPRITRGLLCPEKCGGCCPRFSLDYISNERHPLSARPRQIVINDTQKTIMSDLQLNNTTAHCRYLNMMTGRCSIHGKHPFTCDFELIRFAKYASLKSPNKVTTRLYGRGRQLLRIDNKRGALCKITPPTDRSREDTIRKFKRLEYWADEFGMSTKIKEIIYWLETRSKKTIIL